MRTFAKTEDAWARPAGTWIIRARTPILCKRRKRNYERPDGDTTGSASQSASFAHSQRKKTKYVKRETSRGLYYPQHVIIQARASFLNAVLAVYRVGPNGCCVLRSSSSKFVALGISQRFVLYLTPFGDQPRPGELVPNPLPGRLRGARWQRARRSHPQKDPDQPDESNCFALSEISRSVF